MEHGEPSRPPHCAACPARDRGFCGRLPEPLQERFREAVRPAAPWPPGGEDGGGARRWDLAVVSRGTVSVRNTFEDGRRAITDFMVPGELLHAKEGGIGEDGRSPRPPTSSCA